MFGCFRSPSGRLGRVLVLDGDVDAGLGHGSSIIPILEEQVRPLDVHPRTLVDTDGAGRVLGVDAQPDRVEAAALELGERVAKERLAEPALTVLRQDPENANPPEARLVLGGAGDHDPRELVRRARP